MSPAAARGRAQRGARLLLAAALAAAAAGRAAAGVAEFTPSIVMTNFGEMGQPCLTMVGRVLFNVDNAAKLNANMIKFVPTVHYYGTAEKIDRFCYRNENWGCEEITLANMQRYRDLLAKCVKYAADKGFDIAILAHLDNMKEYTWRNILQFDPKAKYGGYSYADVVLRPMADAVNRAVKPSTRVIFTLNGETGKSVSQYARNWADMVPVVRSWLMAGGRVPRDKAQMAISLNYNKLYGWIDFDSISPEYIAKNFDKEWKEQSAKYPMDLKGMRQLYDIIDVIGLSAYPPLYPGFKLQDLDTPLKYHAQELSYAGINLKDLLNRGKKIVISEWGIGGGTQDGQSIAPTLKDVAGFPFFGLWYPYADYKNPWKRSDYNDYRRYLYRMTADYLSQGGGKEYPIDRVFVWNAGSWDALGVHFQSGGGGGGSWADGEVTDLVKRHNAKA